MQRSFSFTSEISGCQKYNQKFISLDWLARGVYKILILCHLVRGEVRIVVNSGVGLGWQPLLLGHNQNPHLWFQPQPSPK